MKRIILIALLSTFICACIVKKSEHSFFGQVTSVQKTSLLTRKVYSFEKKREPIRVSRKVVVLKDATTRLIYRCKEGSIKSHAVYGKYYLDKVRADTIKMMRKNNSFVSSDFQLIGAFLPAKYSIMGQTYWEKGIVFYEDGSCVHSWVTAGGGDSPSSSEHKRLGEYKIFNDTIYTVYFLDKYYLRLIKPQQNHIKSIDETPWLATEPYLVNYLLSSKNDTLLTFYDSRKPVDKSYLFAADSIKLIPTRKILH
jgi:hypothetical protein